MAPTICVLCPWDMDTGLISKAVQLADNTPIHVLTAQENTGIAAEHGAKKIHTLSTAEVPEDRLAAWLADKITHWRCNIILAPATVKMRNVMPMLAWHLQAGLTADCTALSIEGEQLLQTRPAFGNSLIARIKSLSAIQMATVRPGTFRPVPIPCDAPEIIPEEIEISSPVITDEFQPYKDSIPLGNADIIVAGGAGIGSAQGFQKLALLANRLGGSLAASRCAVDNGFAGFRQQVGMTGVTVCPKLYIAVGISGAVQHLAGMSGSEKIIAINSDPKAPIFDYADYGIVGDWETVIDQLLEELL